MKCSDCANFKAKETPRFKVGDWVICGSAARVLCQIEPEDTITDENPSVRHATPADFTRTVQGVKVRLYEDNSVRFWRHWLYTDTGGISEYLPIHGCTIAVLHALSHVPCDDGSVGIPIIPLSVRGGKFEAPE